MKTSAGKDGEDGTCGTEVDAYFSAPDATAKLTLANLSSKGKSSDMMTWGVGGGGTISAWLQKEMERLRCGNL